MKLGTRSILLPACLAKLLAAAIVLATVLAPSAAHAAAAAYPRLGVWWPDVSKYSDSEMARYDYVVLADWMASRLPAIKAENPGMIGLRGANACELTLDPTKPNTDLSNVAIAKASARWLLTQVGTTLAASVSATSTTLPVAATTASGKTLFAVADFVVVDEEIMKVTAVGLNTITVVRGQIYRATSHGSGTRIAAAIQFYPKTLVFDVTAACPRVTVDAAVGPETWNEWNARQAAASISDPAWSGVFLDRTDANESWLVGGGYARTIDQDRSNTVVTDYTTFNAAWNAGLVELEGRLRALVGDRIILGNTAYPVYEKLNGSLFEHFPDKNGGWGLRSWHDAVVGPGFTKGSYLTDWMVKSLQPNLTSILTYECDVTPTQATGDSGFDNPFLKPGFAPNYRKMRFGLTTALLGDGYFYYAPGTKANNGHGLMWFDEYDNAGQGRGYLGWPIGSAHLAFPPVATTDLLNGSGAFDSVAQVGSWGLSANSGAGYAGAKSFDSSQRVSGIGSVRFDVTSVGNGSGGITGVFLSKGLAVGVNPGHDYTVRFSAKASRSMNLLVKIKGTTDWVTFGTVNLGTEWQTFELSGSASGWDSSAQIRFAASEQTGSIWLDDVTTQEGRCAEVWRRDFTGGASLVNASDSTVTVSLGGTYRKIKGTQAPTVNDGSLVTAVTLPPKDGLVLLRTAAVVTPPDTTPPVTTISGVPSGWTNHDVPLSLTATDAGSPTGISTFYGLNASASSAYSGPVTVRAQGVTTVSYRSADAVGNAETAKTAAVRIDKTLPTLSQDTVATYTGSATVRASATDALSGLDRVEMRLDSGPWTAVTQISTSVLGAHTVDARAFDVAGNERGVSGSFTVIAVPIVPVLPPAPAGTLTVAGGATQVTSADVALVSAVSGATDMRIDAGSGTFGAWTAFAGSAHITLAHTGVNAVRVEYRNAGGTTQLTDTVELIVVVTPPPTVDPTVTLPPVVPPTVEPTVTLPPVVPPTVDPTVTVPPTPVPATVTLRASATTIDYGHSATFNIAVVPATAVQFRLEERAAGQTSWTPVATMTSNDSGLASLTVSPLVNTGYRVVLADGTVSPVVTIQVKALATVRSSRRTVSGKRSVTFAGTVSSAASLNNTAISALTSEDTSASVDTTTAPPVPLVRAVLQRKVRHHWVTVKAVSMDPTGSYRVNIRPPRHHARYSYRIYVATSAANGAAASRIVKIRVH